MIKSSGALFYSRTTNRYLFLLRNTSKYNNTWGFAGGKVEQNETEFSALKREVKEELGFMPRLEKTVPLEKFTSEDGNFEYYTYVCVVKKEFTPRLNGEHKGYAWTTLDGWPKPLHPGVFSTLAVDTIQNKIKTLEKILNA